MMACCTGRRQRKAKVAPGFSLFSGGTCVWQGEGGARGGWNGADGKGHQCLVVSSHVGNGMVEAEEVDVFASEQGYLGQRLTHGVEELTQALQEARLADVVCGLKVGNALRRRAQPERIAIEGEWGLPPGWWDD